MTKQHLNQLVMPIAFLALGGSTELLAQEPKPTIKKVQVEQTSPGSGKEMFHAYCASCHGVDGKGDGPAAPALKTPPKNLTLLAQENGGKFPTAGVMNSITDVTNNVHGAKDMPIWGPILSSVSGRNPDIVRLRVHNLARYIDSLQVK